MRTRVVDYGTPATRPSWWDPALMWIAFACGLVPMVAGVLVTGAKLLSGRPAGLLEIAGVLIIAGGVLLFVVGILCCSAVAARARAVKRPWRTWLPRTALAVTLLLANFPLAAACIHAAHMSRVRVVNNSPGVVTSLIVTDPVGRTWQLGPIAPGKSKSRMMRFDGEGSVTYAATTNLPAGPVNSNGTISGYITSGTTGERHTITINADGTSTPPP